VRKILVAVLVLFGTSLSASPDAGAIRVVNLGTRTITAFNLVGFGFRDVGLDRRPGDVLTPAFASDVTKYELFWRLDDGSVHGETVELAEHLPPDAYSAPVVIGIHDDTLSVTWAERDPRWSRPNLDGKWEPVTGPGFTRCEGPLLTHPLATAAWGVRAREMTSKNPSINPAEHHCSLDWYIPYSNRQREQVDEQTEALLRAEWHAEIEAFKTKRE